MKKQKSRSGCLFAGLLVIILMVIVGGWWYFRSQTETTEINSSSSVLVFLLSPSSGDEMQAGDYVPVTAQVTAPESIMSVELFVDGQLLESSQSGEWSWQAWPVGIHTLVARATSADGQIGQSQTVIVNVLAGDGVFDVSAKEGQTLEQIGAGFGVPPDQMAGANPNVDPTLPLTDGQPVQVPVSDGNAGGGGAGNGPGPGGDLPPISLITWQFKPTEPVDKSYCYLSFGNGVWEKMPKKPFEFLGGAQANYQQYELSPNNGGVIQAQCWGWLGGALKYLGQGETQFDVQKPPKEVKISGGGFVLVGMPQIPDATGGGPNGIVTPPFALRKPMDTAECTSHGNPLLAPFICETLLNASVKEYVILVWEWKPELCWPGFCKYEINEIDGYMIYEINPLAQTSTYFLKEIDNPNQKVTAIPMPWGATKCYGVTALAGGQESEMATYCPDKPPSTQKVTLTKLENWVTGVDMLETGSDCDGVDYGYSAISPLHSFGYSPGEVVVGAYTFDDDCYQNVYSRGAVKFSMQSELPANAVIQKATLRFSTLAKHYLSKVIAGPAPATCAAGVGKAKQDWSPLVDSDHRVKTFGLYNTPISSIGQYGPLQADVTAAVKDWVKNPATNHGFVLSSINPPPGGVAFCISGLGNFQLDIYYFAP